MYIAELWRYPVKSLRGQRLEAAELRADGIVGDRVVQVRAGDGSLLTARTAPDLLGLDGAIGDDGPQVCGYFWESSQAAAAVRAVAGEGARLVLSGDQRFDDTPLLVATDGAIAALAEDGRRLRPNIVIGGVEGLAEREWRGRTILAGEVAITVEKVCLRCVVTTFDPDTRAQDAAVLRRINELFGGRIALNCHVAKAGRAAVGDLVQLI